MRLGIFVLALALLGVAFGANSSNAHAHAQYIRSQPEENAVLAQGPIEVLIWYTESVEIGFSEIQVVDATGARVDNGDTHVHFDPTNPGITLKPNLTPGTYTVAWRMLSAVDGHRTAGTFAFSVGQVGPPASPPAGSITFEDAGSQPPRWLTVLNRWLAFAAMASLIGAVAFPALVLPAGLRATRDRPPVDSRIVDRVTRTTRISVWASLAVAAITTAVSLWLQSWAAGGSASSFSSVQDVWTDTRFGDVFTLRVSILIGAVMLAVIALARLRGLLEKEDLREPAWIALGICALALPLTTSLNSHSAAERSATELWVASDWLHLVAGSIWIGGLLQLVVLTPVVLSLTERRAAFLAGLIPRFSLVAMASVSVVVATGFLQWWKFLGLSISPIFDSDWGATLLVKVTLLLPLLLIAAFNLLIVRPRFLSFVFQGAKTASARILAWERRFRWAVAAEVGFAVAILIVAAMLTESSIPTRGSAAQSSNGGGTSVVPTPSGLAQSLQAEDLNLSLDVYPGKAGPNEVGVFLDDMDGDEKPVQMVIVRFKYLDRPLGENEDFAQALHPTHYVLQTSQMSLAGSWEIEVIVRREGLNDARGTFTVELQA